MNFSERSLVQQGYNCPVGELRNISNGLRFTPLLCMFLAIYGLYIQNPYLHFAIAAMGILPFWFPGNHPIDLIYNYGFRHLVGGQKLPNNPLPRRIACLMGGLMNLGIGFSFLYSNVILAYVFGVVLIVLQLVVITTHFCVASWMYESFMKLIGKWENYISAIDAERLISQGAVLIDVREKHEFAVEHIQGAINIPLSDVGINDHIANKPVVLYCQSGMRSTAALNKLISDGHAEVYNLGGMHRWSDK